MPCYVMTALYVALDCGCKWMISLLAVSLVVFGVSYKDPYIMFLRSLEFSKTSVIA